MVEERATRLVMTDEEVAHLTKVAEAVVATATALCPEASATSSARTEEAEDEEDEEVE